MKVDKNIQEQIVRNLENWRIRSNKHLEDMIRDVEKACSVEDLMYYKQWLLIEYVRSIPLDTEICYFCLLHIREKNSDDCSHCEYGKVKGICTDEESFFNQLNKARAELIHVCRNYHGGVDYEINEGGR